MKSAVQLAKRIKNGQITVEQVIESVYASIEVKEKDYHCYISLREKEEVVREANILQKEILAGKYATSSIAGMPVAIKDNICTKGLKTTCASKMLENFEPVYSAEVVHRLKQAGAIIIGKTNMDEFGMGSTTETSYFGVTKNPYDMTKVAGGSSGGSATALVNGECIIAIGSDTGGSVRQPASYCGVVGLKPTYGTVSRYGLIAYTSSLEQIGPMTNTVEDCAFVLEVLAGADEKDMTSRKRENYDFTSALGQSIAGKKVAIPKDFLVEGVQEEIKQAIYLAGEQFRKQGAIVEEIQLGMSEYAVPIYCVITGAEASSNLARFDGVKYGYRTKEYDSLQEMYEKSRTEGFGEEVQKRILFGSLVLSEAYYEDYYKKAKKLQRALKRIYANVFQTYDIILGPVAPRTAPNIGESKKDVLMNRLEDIYTVPANLVGIPAISVPFGTDKRGLPIGVQLMAKHYEERLLFQMAYALEQAK